MNDKIDRVVTTVDNISDLKIKMDSYSDNAIKKYLSDLYTISEKTNTAVTKIDDKLNSQSEKNFKTALTSNNVEYKNNISTDLKNILNNVKGEKIKDNEKTDINNTESNSKNHLNNPLNELKTLEKDILIVLKRLEKAESNSKQTT